MADLVALASRYPNLVRGFKVRAVPASDGSVPALATGAAARRETGLPLMVHLGRFPYAEEIGVGEICDALDSGDLLTHAFRSGRGGILDPQGRIEPAVREAVERGVGLDVGHERSFRFEVLEKALEAGLRPATAGSDLARNNQDLPDGRFLDVLSKLLVVGMPPLEVFAAATVVPARILGQGDRLGALRVGAEADLTVLRYDTPPGGVTLLDAHGVGRQAPGRLRLVATIRAGRAVAGSASLAAAG